MNANDPRESADTSGKNPSVGPDAIDDLVRDVRSRAAAAGTPSTVSKGRGIGQYLRTHPLQPFAAVAAALIVIVVIRAWPTIDEATGTLASRLISALTPTRLVEPPAGNAAEADRPATAVRPRAARPAPGVKPSPVPESSSAVPSGERALGAESNAGVARTTDAPSAVASTPDSSGMRADFVYSSADADVKPPKLLSEGPGQPASVMSERTRVLELLVMSNGSVDQVRLRSTEPQLMDPILLSRAKMWQFEPAQRGGRAVPYRLVLLWDAPR